MPAETVQGLKKISFIYSLLLRWKLTPLGKRLHERAQQLGYRLSFHSNRIVLSGKEGRELWLPFNVAGELWGSMETLAQEDARYVYKQRGARLVADLRGDQPYLLPGTSDRVRLPWVPEAVDLVAGYFGKGAPAAGAVAFDCGAYCGEITIVLARKVGETGKVFAFEPDDKNRSRLERNIAEAGLKNVTVVAKGLWKQTDTLSFVADGNLGSHVQERTSASQTITVPVIGFEEACRIAGAVPSFVKMDIEGAEVEAIEGSLDFISRHSIRFAIASYHDRNGKPTSVLLETLFKKAGYQVTTGFPEHQTTWAWKE